ncbi:MAG: DUF1232 domain-containing protein [Dermatophilaceae bacterium]
MVLAVVYIVSPIDLLPEAFLTLPGMMTDDAGIAAWLIAALFGATTAYRHWESGRVDSPTVEDPRAWSRARSCTPRRPPLAPA